jgi:NADH-quinone oxidoreductase subunit G
MVKLLIDDQEVEVASGTTILKACEAITKEIPVFCYHPRLKVAGNCRMCLVEVEKSPKPVASCATPVAEGMVVHTKTPMVEQARKGVLELLLINHPLDCPICDQGGECDLQDLTLNYGPGNSRYKFYKRAVPNKYMGPFIKTVMNRCIHCTRCVRFATEIAGVQEMGSHGRGEHTEIISYLDKAVTSELSGNMIDICPVGALTNKPYAFHGRPWELQHTDSIDVLDAVGSHIRLDVRDSQVLRIVPRLNEDINEEWISDKIRFAYDGLSSQRLDKTYIRKDGELVACSWNEAFEAIKIGKPPSSGTPNTSIS